MSASSPLPPEAETPPPTREPAGTLADDADADGAPEATRERGMILKEKDAGLSGVSYQRALRFGGTGALAAQLRRFVLAAVCGVAGLRVAGERMDSSGIAGALEGSLLPCMC